ncbi:MAG TPA: tetratricopeptide repeat protein [Candidatus Melainabacteria bacterium]|nr:tetratricopeptide repeat protein [Candidatus Melainabacteria bacterium]
MGPDVSHSLLKEPITGACRSFLPRANDLIRFSVVLLLIGSFFSDWVLEAGARSYRRVSARRAQRSAKTSRNVHSGRRVSSGRARRAPAKSLRAPAQHGPTAAQIRKQETSGANDLEKRTDLERSYRAYDHGLTEWLAGNYAQAAKYLNESYEIYSDFHGAHDVLDSIYLYDLGQVAEAAGDLSLAKNSYQRSLRRRPDFSDCCIRLTALLTKNGETALALVYARRLAEKNPQDPRAQLLLANMLEKAGFIEEGKAAKENFRLLMRGGVITSPPKNEVTTDTTLNKDSDDSPEQKADKVEKEDTDSDNKPEKNANSSGKENSDAAGALRKPNSESEDK